MQFTYQLRNTAPQMVQKYNVIAFSVCLSPWFLLCVYKCMFPMWCFFGSVPPSPSSPPPPPPPPGHSQPGAKSNWQFALHQITSELFHVTCLAVCFLFLSFPVFVSSSVFLIGRKTPAYFYFYRVCLVVIFPYFVFFHFLSSVSGYYFPLFCFLLLFYPVCLVIIFHLNAFDVALKFFSHVVFKFMSL